MPNGAVYERTVRDGTVTVPEKHAAQEACVIAGVQVLGYPQVQSDGTVEVDERDGLAVKVVIPSDETMEAHD